ncbi:hypothetical protein B0T16DRAFT_516568 [Cercophora newfieldiana]|uniref:Zn(2)-C6 fungal-type domain-containing protein n=1 Tax=Cercophora newfieldiana TaxID=92897 RepID=A0AA40CKQ6_9PEZI|nr:hypothetical protein B0T16DRAFT_516568 [Cercophora newfieldiana]
MAQPSVSSLSRLSPENLDLSSVELHAPPGTTQTQHHQHQPHRNHHDEQQHHQQQQLAPQRGGSPQPPYADNAKTSETCTHPVGDSTRHVSGGDEDGTSDGGSAANAHTSTRAPNTESEEWLGEDLHIGRKETRYDGDTPLLASPPMSNTQQPQGPRQQLGYPSPTSYPPAGMPPTAHYAYPPQAAPPPDPYRQAPTSLPSMRTLDHVPSQQQQQHTQQQQQHAMMTAHMGAPMAPAPPMGYYSVPPHAYGIHADPNAMRFAMAPGMADPRIALSGGRHKKEIKRRTKTGCLTCRKRRIKCDEAHPTCNNCKKSKRECLGYDPIFKQQQQGPTAIQPAPNSQPAPAATLASTPTLPSSTTHSPYHAQPPIVPSSYPPSVPSSITFDSPVSSTAHSVKTEPNFDYSAAIDPALQGGDLSTSADTPTSQYQQLRGEGVDEETGVSPNSKAKMKVDELIAMGGVALPPTPSSPPTAETLDEITKLYHELYVQGLSLFFESRWYELKDAHGGSSAFTSVLHQNPTTLALFTSFLQAISEVKTANTRDLGYSSHLELYLIWALARLPGYFAANEMSHQYNGMASTEDSASETINRVKVFDTLVSGDTLSHNPLPPTTVDNTSTARQRELEFWHHLGEYVHEKYSSSSPADTAAREYHLGHLRSRLDGRENRDVLYSIAVLREYTARWEATANEPTVPSHLEETDPRCKLAVATRFIRDEAASSGSAGGTTNVVRRLAEVAYRSFVRPGLNAGVHRREV